MGYLEQFARNRRSKEKTEVLTARLPQSLYGDFKVYCDELGLSISEAVCLLVEHEIKGIESEVNTKNDINNDKEKHIVVVENTNTNTNVVEVKQKTSGTNTSKRFTVKHWVVDGELPCPKCNQWVKQSNFARHAKHHGSNTVEFFTDEESLKIVNEMIKERNIEHQGS